MHLHTFSYPLTPDNPHERRCRDCGEPQVYRPPTGSGRTFPDVLVDKEDLRALVEYVAKDRHSAYLLGPDLSDALVRVERLLD